MSQSISGNKDTDRLILNNLDDSTFLKLLPINKYFYYKVCTENYFMERTILKYPEVIKYRDTSWKPYYFQIIKYIKLLQKDYNYRYNRKDKNPELLYRCKRLIPNNIVYTVKEALKYAVTAEDLQLVKYLTSRIRNIGKQHLKLSIFLLRACEIGNLPILEHLVDSGVMVNPDALSMACYKGHFHIIEYLLKKGMEVNADNYRALRIGIIIGHWPIFKLLIDYGAVLDAAIITDINEYVRIHLNLNIIMYLHDNNFNIHLQNNRLLREALKCGNLEIIKYLVEHGGDINCRGYYDFVSACVNENFPLVKYLVGLGMRDDELRTAMFETHSRNLLEMKKYLKSVLSPVNSKFFSNLINKLTSNGN